MAQNKNGIEPNESRDKGAEISQKIKAGMRKAAAFFIKLGEHTVQNSKKLAGFLKHNYHRFGKRPEKRVRFYFKKWYRKLRVFALNLKAFVMRPIRKIGHAFDVLRESMKEVKDRSFREKSVRFFKTLWTGFRRNRKIGATILNYTLPVLGIAMFLYVVNFAGSLTFAVSVSYNGENLGYVKDEAVVNSATEIVQGRMVYLDDSERLDIEPTFSVKIMDKDDVLTEYQLADAIISLSDDEMVQAEGIYIDDKFYGAVENAGTVKTTLDNILNEYKTGAEGEEVSFVNQIDVISGLYVKDNIITQDAAVELLSGEKQSEVYYTIKEGDTPSGVASDNDIKYADLKALNPDIENPSKFRPGDQVLLTKSEPFLPVQVKRTVTYTESVAYSTNTTESAKYAKGTTKVVKEGENGENSITANVTYVNNIEVSREIITTKVVKEPVTKEVVKGTAEPVSNISSYKGSSSGLSGSSGSGKVDYGFIWPFSGYISAPYGFSAVYGSSMHTGLDIARYGGALNKPIVACAPGKVIWSGWNGAYGKLIKIDHGNGVQTWYAHCNALQVSVGEYVSQGQQIGLVGSTGNSTGPHLHLEVRINGIHRNPLNYLP